MKPESECFKGTTNTIKELPGSHQGAARQQLRASIRHGPFTTLRAFSKALPKWLEEPWQQDQLCTHPGLMRFSAQRWTGTPIPAARFHLGTCNALPCRRRLKFSLPHIADAEMRDASSLGRQAFHIILNFQNAASVLGLSTEATSCLPLERRRKYPKTEDRDLSRS